MPARDFPAASRTAGRTAARILVNHALPNIAGLIAVQAASHLAHRMAWRSLCAHGGWADVAPAPHGQGLPPWPAVPVRAKGRLPECR